MNRWFFALALGVATTSAEAAPPCEEPHSPEAVEAAKGLHRAAELHFREGRLAAAIDAWQLAYELDCEAHRLLINIGNAEARRGRPERAVDAYETYLERAGEGDLPRASERLAELRAEAAEGGRSVDLPSEPRSTAVALVIAGVGSAVAVAGAVSLGVGVAAEVRANDACPELASCPYERLDDRTRGILLEEIGGGLLAVGVATALGSLLAITLHEAPIEASLGLGGASLRLRF